MAGDNKCIGYQRRNTYGQFLDGNPCAACGKPEVDHFTAWFLPVMGVQEGEELKPLTGYIIVHTERSFEAVALAGTKGYLASGSIREATAADSKPLKTLRPWS